MENEKEKKAIVISKLSKEQRESYAREEERTAIVQSPRHNEDES
jgi:hypothetical protein